MISGFEFPFAFVGQFGSRCKHGICPGEKICFCHCTGGEVVPPWLEDGHLHCMDVINAIVGIQGAKCIAHHLRIVFCIYQNAQTIFKVNDVKYIIRYDEAVPRSKAIRHPSGKIKSMFYKHQRIFTEFLCFFELFHDEVAVFLCAVFHLCIVVVQIFGRITPGFSKSLQNFIFTEFMCICSLLCIRTCPVLDLCT